ncbi:nuclear protein 2 [Erythrolamprus reginae]|uniref:nuclear protein 2 n=1 Tax=Erythrolamprus reginae TaxID=121349 RepID=UPI00396CE5F9
MTSQKRERRHCGTGGEGRRAAMRSGRNVSRAPSSGSEESEWEEERVARLRERAWRDGPRGPGSGGKGRSRRSREQRTNWRVPAGHERKITAKIRATLAKRRLQQRPGRGPRSAPLQPRKRAQADAKTPEMATC